MPIPLLDSLPLATLSFAACCGGDFNSFVASMPVEADAASQGISL
jgi:hypothetical protein